VGLRAHRRTTCRALSRTSTGDRTLWLHPSERDRGPGLLARRRIRDMKGADWRGPPGCAHCPTLRCRRGEPLLAASCNMLAARSRSKPSRWWETTRAEQDRSDGIDRPKRGVPLGSGRDRWKSAEGRSREHPVERFDRHPVCRSNLNCVDRCSSQVMGLSRSSKIIREPRYGKTSKASRSGGQRSRGEW
jgi:hypothetical protein